MTTFMGYGSPEALEAALAEGQNEDFIVYAEGLFHASVCSSLAQEEVAKRMKTRLCGTDLGWMLSKEAFSNGSPNPCPCNKYPQTHRHFLFDA